MTIRLVLGFFLAYFLALVGTPMAREAALRFGVVDRPDGALKNHREPVAYLGGLAVFIAFLFAGLVYIWLRKGLLWRHLLTRASSRASSSQS